jgi:F0F1-type ATP synthase assembly protein I
MRTKELSRSFYWAIAGVFMAAYVAVEYSPASPEHREERLEAVMNLPIVMAVACVAGAVCAVSTGYFVERFFRRLAVVEVVLIMYLLLGVVEIASIVIRTIRNG